MNRMYGNIQRVITVARSNAPGSRARPEAISHTRSRGRDHAEHRHAEQDPEERRGHVADEQPRLRLVPLRADVREHRHEGLLEGALGEHPAQQVRQPERHVEGVRLGARPEQAGDQHVPHEPGDPGQQGQAADGGKGAEQVQTGGSGLGPEAEA